MEKLPSSKEKIIIIPRVPYNAKDTRPLGTVYYEKYGGLLKDIKIVEASINGKLYVHNLVKSTEHLFIR